MKKSEFLFTISRIFSDFFAIFFALILAYFLRMNFFEFFNFAPPTTLFPFATFKNFAAKISLFLILIFAANGRYKFSDENFFDEIAKIFWAFSAGFSILFVISYFFPNLKFYFFSRLIFGFSWIFGIFLIFFGRLFLRIIRNFFWKLNFGRRKILLFGNGKLAAEILKKLKISPRFEILGILSEKKIAQKNFKNEKILGDFSAAEKIIKNLRPAEIWLATENPTEKITEKLARIAHIFHAKFRFLPDELALDLAAVKISTFAGTPIISLENTKMAGWPLVLKYFFDFFFAIFLLIFLSPIFFIISILIFFENPAAPIFFKSLRVGKNGKKFFCLKFRTMVPDAEKLKKKLLKKNERRGGVLFKIKNDPRVTKIGKFLRQSSLDEIPQIFNILKFEMSFIGPRPHLPDEIEKYEKDDLRVLSVRPGISGFAQIHGRENLSFRDEMKFELFYLKNWNLWLDAIIFLKTIFLVFSKKNAS